jgi:hypothetical protein
MNDSFCDIGYEEFSKDSHSHIIYEVFLLFLINFFPCLGMKSCQTVLAIS